MTGDSFHILAIDVPLALVLVAPCLLLASTRRVSNAPLVVPAIVLFVLGLSSLYVALTEDPSTTALSQNPPTDSDLLRHQHELTHLTLGTLLAATLMFLLGLLYRDYFTISFWRKRFAAVFWVLCAMYGACTLWLLIWAHRGASLARHISEHLRA